MQTEIIMVTHNNLELTKRTIASIQKYTNQDYKLIIIDNNSNSKMRNWLLGLLSPKQNVSINFQKENLGPAGARNAGMRCLSDDCEYVLFVDNDIKIIQDDWLPRLLTGFIDKNVGAVGPCSDFVSGLQTIKLKTSKQYFTVPFLITFCMLVRRKIADKIGEFDGFGVNWGNTDIDYSVRMRRAGYKLINARDVIVKHAGYETKRRQDELTKLKEKFIKKWGQENYDDIYDYNKWLNLPGNREERRITIIGINDDKKKQIEEKLDRIGLGAQISSFQSQVPSLNNLPIVLSEKDQKKYESKLDQNKKLALFELPATCNLGCDYCYVNDRKINNQDYNSKHFSDWLHKIDDNVQWIVWLCSEGEPGLYPEYDKIIDRLVMRDNYIVATTTNLTQDPILNLHPDAYDSLGILWSVHYSELERKGLLDSTFERARILADKGASIAPLIIVTKAHLKRFEEINDRFGKIGLKPTLRHERIFPKNKQWYHRKLTELWELQAVQRAREWGWSLTNYDYEHLRFHVKGGSCSAGTHFLATLTDWSTASCCGCGRQLGKFPEVPKEYVQGVCTAEVCPCPFPHEFGMNSKILTPTMSQSYFYNNQDSALFRALDVYLPNGLNND